MCASRLAEAAPLCLSRGLAAMVVSLEVRRARGLEAGRDGWADDGDRMDEEMEAVLGLQRRAPGVGCVLLCPLKQLGHAATYRGRFPCAKSTLLSRPTRLATLHAALMDCLSGLAPLHAAAAAVPA